MNPDEQTANEQAMSPFLFDDFFVTEEATVEIRPVLRGRVVPIQIKKGISLADREAAKAVALKSHLDPSGQMVIDGIDQLKLNVEALVRIIKKWPFEMKDGSMVPITREFIAKLGGDCVDAIMTEMAKVINAAEEAHAPFGKASDAA